MLLYSLYVAQGVGINTLSRHYLDTMQSFPKSSENYHGNVSYIININGLFYQDLFLSISLSSPPPVVYLLYLCRSVEICNAEEKSFLEPRYLYCKHCKLSQGEVPNSIREPRRNKTHLQNTTTT